MEASTGVSKVEAAPIAAPVVNVTEQVVNTTASPVGAGNVGRDIVTKANVTINYSK